MGQGNRQTSEERAALDGHQRLSPHVVPRRYALDLNIDPARDRFDGRVAIEVDVALATRLVALHAQNLDVTAAWAEVGGERRPAVVVGGTHGAAGLTFEEPLPTGRAKLHLEWRGRMTQVPEGLYRVRAGDDWYAYTQFEPFAARRVFPCFDEPGYKAPYAVTLRVPRGLVAVANSQETGVRTEGDRDVHVFAETAPLASYLVAFAVGPFDVVSAPPGAIGPPPLRVITTRGSGHLADYALRRTPAILEALERWFGRPYPYDKLDLVGVPNFAAGAMENVGLVTFREKLVLLEGEHAPAPDRLWAQVVIAHELAHMWFGNLVTLRWWDDLWLNEAFATWMEMAIVQAVDPALEASLEAVRETGSVMDHDALAEARAVRQPIESGGDVLNAFDGITYGKGAALVRMIHDWLGPEKFRQGVRAYIDAHAHGNAVTTDLLTALEAAGGRPVSETLGTFLDQPGTPLVDVAIDGAAVTLRQARYRPAGSRAPEGQPWSVPVRLRYGRNGDVHERSFLLKGREQTVQLDAPADWVHPNADESGYYRWRLPPDALFALTGEYRNRLTPAERVSLPAHLWALLESGDVAVDTYLRALENLGHDPHRLVVAGLVTDLRRLARVALGDEERAAFAPFARALLRPHADRIGIAPRSEEPEAHRLLRPALLPALAEVASDAEVLAALREAAEAFLRDVARGDAAVAQYALPVAAAEGDAKLFDRLRDALSRAPTPSHRSPILQALGSFADDALATRGFDTFLTDAVRAQDVFTLLRPALRLDRTQLLLWGWLDRHYDAVVEKIGDELAASLPMLAKGFRDADGGAKAEGMFASAGRRKPGLDRNLRQVLEDIDRRSRLSAATGEPLRRFLATWRGPRPA